ncbi:hypothetical protein [Chromobacterium subtsugae]|uniref:hypothetical protein n=1 Tax=Chromobacterium subtsugae TaxID=251747 RepID=UPI000B0829FC|nr:hypothetical protein [Chromobacterium subtsugae]
MTISISVPDQYEIACVIIEAKDLLIGLISEEKFTASICNNISAFGLPSWFISSVLECNGLFCSERCGGGFAYFICDDFKRVLNSTLCGRSLTSLSPDDALSIASRYEEWLPSITGWHIAASNSRRLSR